MTYYIPLEREFNSFTLFFKIVFPLDYHYSWLISISDKNNFFRGQPSKISFSHFHIHENIEYYFILLMFICPLTRSTTRTKHPSRSKSQTSLSKCPTRTWMSGARPSIRKRPEWAVASPPASPTPTRKRTPPTKWRTWRTIRAAWVWAASRQRLPSSKWSWRRASTFSSKTPTSSWWPRCGRTAAIGRIPTMLCSLWHICLKAIAPNSCLLIDLFFSFYSEIFRVCSVNKVNTPFQRELPFGTRSIVNKVLRFRSPSMQILTPKTFQVSDTVPGKLAGAEPQFDIWFLSIWEAINRNSIRVLCTWNLSGIKLRFSCHQCTLYLGFSVGVSVKNSLLFFFFFLWRFFR